ncbi:MAG TPA: hypothetical protein VFZ61_17130 [Polyangiales bacterium]
MVGDLGASLRLPVAMQYLLDFIYEHLLDEQLYCVLPSPSGELALQWRRREDALRWELKPLKREGAVELVARVDLLARLSDLGADLHLFECELRAIIAAQVVVADHLLRDARARLGAEAVDEMLHGHALFATELSRTVSTLLGPARPALQLVSGGGACSGARTGHLALVR